MKKLILIPLLALFSLTLAAKTDSTAVVTHAYLDGSPADAAAGIGDIIVVHVKNWKSVPAAQQNVKQLRLYVNSMEIGGPGPMGWDLLGDDAEFKFLLERTNANDSTWNAILGYPLFGKQFFDLPVSVSVGAHGQSGLPTKVDAFTFMRIYRSWFWFCLVILAIYFVVFFYYAITSPMLRDAPADLTPLNIPGLDAGNAPFSLGKVQMAFWFSVVLASYLFIWLITDNYELITSGTLVLVGIGAGTALGAVSINNSKSSGTVKQVQDLQAQQSDLQQATALLAAAPGPGIDGKIAYNNFLNNQLSAKINKLIDSLKSGKDTFVNDILTDENGISFHRLQMVAFTLVLGMVFIYSVWAELTMPSFSATLLTMQGITAGTYLGFKIPEKQI